MIKNVQLKAIHLFIANLNKTQKKTKQTIQLKLPIFKKVEEKRGSMYWWH